MQRTLRTRGKIMALGRGYEQDNSERHWQSGWFLKNSKSQISNEK
jgi:hypothetical protein